MSSDEMTPTVRAGGGIATRANPALGEIIANGGSSGSWHVRPSGAQFTVQLGPKTYEIPVADIRDAIAPLTTDEAEPRSSTIRPGAHPRRHLPAPPKRDGGFGALVGAAVGSVLEVAVIVCVWEFLGWVL